MAAEVSIPRFAGLSFEDICGIVNFQVKWVEKSGRRQGNTEYASRKIQHWSVSPDAPRMIAIQSRPYP